MYVRSEISHMLFLNFKLYHLIAGPVEAEYNEVCNLAHNILLGHLLGLQQTHHRFLPPRGGGGLRQDDQTSGHPGSGRDINLSEVRYCRYDARYS